MPVDFKYKIIITVFLLFPVLSQTAQEIPQPPDRIISIGISPGVSVPVGGDEELYTTGFYTDMKADYRFPEFPVISLEAGGEYSYIPIKALITMSTYAGGGGVGFNFDLSPRFLMRLNSMAGYSYSVINSGISKGTGSGGFYYTGGGDLSFRYSQEWSFGIGSSYVNHGQLYQGLRGAASASYFINLDSTHAVQIDNDDFIEIFPALINYHNTVPVYTALIRNTEDYNAGEIKYELTIKNYMDDTIYTDGPSVLTGGGKADVNLIPLFNKDIKTAASSSGKKSIEIPLKVLIRYKYNNWKYKEKAEKTLILYNQNSVRWDDPAKISVFITPEEPSVKTLTENTISAVDGKSRIPVPEKVLKALSLYKTLENFGLKFLPDTETPYPEGVKPDPQGQYPVDLVSYPSEVLYKGIGETDEFAVLFNSMLESAGIKTAIIVTPEACLTAFALDDDGLISHSDLMIKHENKIWVPVDPRNPEKSFDSAVTGALRIWDSCAEGEKKIISLETARSRYFSPSPPEDKGLPKTISDEVIEESYLADIKNYAYWEIRPEEEMLKDIQKLSKNEPEVTNRLGVLYARFEKYKEAYTEFEKASGREYAPAMVNLANLYFLDGRLEEALPLYEKAYRKNAYNTSMLQNMAVAYYKRLDFGFAREVYRKLDFLDSEMGEDISFMAERDSAMTETAASGHEKGFASLDIFTDNAMLEKGNQYYIEKQLKQALAFYEKAYIRAPRDPEVLLSLARVNYELDNYYTASVYLEDLKKIDPEKAEANNYLVSEFTGATMKTALENLKGDVNWAEE